MHLTKEEADRIIRQQDLQGAQEMFRVAGAGGIQAKHGRYGVSQYAAQDVPPVDIGNMPGTSLAQGQPQYANLMNIRNRLAPRYFG